MVSVRIFLFGTDAGFAELFFYPTPTSLRSDSRSNSSRGCCLHITPCVQELRLPVAPNTLERYHPFRQEYHVPQGYRLVHCLLDCGSRNGPYVQLCEAFHGIFDLVQGCLCRLLVDELHNWAWGHRLDNAHLPGAYCLVRDGKETQGQL